MLRILLQETYEVQDCHFYDTASSEGVSKYDTPIPLQSTTTNCEITYDSTMTAYKVTDKSNSIKGIPVKNISNLDDVTIDVDLYVRGGTSVNSVVGIFGGNANNGFDYLLTNSTSYAFAKNIFTGTTQSISLSTTIKGQQWVHLQLTITNGSVSAVFSQESTTIVSDTISINYIPSNYGVATGWGNNYYAWFKNLKIKAL